MNYNMDPNVQQMPQQQIQSQTDFGNYLKSKGYACVPINEKI